MNELERERLERVLTPEELADPEVVERAVAGFKEVDLAAWEHEVAHETVARLLGAGWEQHVVGEGIITGTVFQSAVVGAAGPVWDRMNDRYLRTSEGDEDAIRGGQSVGYDRAFLFSVAEAILSLHADHVRERARETQPPGPIQEIR